MQGAKEVGVIDPKENLIRLMERYQDLVFSLCLKLTGDYFTAEDITQETFLAAYGHWAEFDGGSEKAWLCRIAGNKCVDYLRSAQQRSIPTAPEEMPEVSSPEVDPQRIFETEETMGRLRAACRDLPEPYGKTAAAYFLEGKTARQIADAQGENIKSVQTRIGRARAMLRKKIRREDLTP